jgi:hypothetical protein
MSLGNRVIPEAIFLHETTKINNTGNNTDWAIHMKKISRIWPILIAILVTTTLASGILWVYYFRSWDKTEIQNIMHEYHTLKVQLDTINSEKQFFSLQIVDEASGEREINYYRAGSVQVISEFYDRGGNLTRIEYDSNGDGIKDIIEYYKQSSRNIDNIQFDTNNDGKFEVFEKDINNNSIIESNDIKIDFQGQFIPLSSFGNIIM